MEEIPQITTDVIVGGTVCTGEVTRPTDNEPSRSATTRSVSRYVPVAFSFADQALAVGGNFLVNVALARTQSKEEYGMFALSYSVFTFLAALHNAAIIEPYSVYGSGRYRGRFSQYLRLMTQGNALIGLLLSAMLLLACLVLSWLSPHLLSRALVGLGLTVGVLLSGVFLRRVFYVQGQASLAAKSSLIFFITVTSGLWLMAKAHWLDSFSVFLLLAAGWIAAGAACGGKLAFGDPKQRFLELEPQYWREHWNYSRWALSTAFVFQLTTQGYYWLLAGILSAKEVAELRAMYLLIAPVDQVFIALSYLVIPSLAAHYAAKRIKKFVALWRRFALATVAITVLFALVVRLVGSVVVHLLYAGKYDGLAPFLSLLAFLPLVMGVGNTIGNALSAGERPKLVFVGYLCSGAATFLLGTPLVIHFGLRGAIYGMLLSGFIYTCSLAVGLVSTLHGAAHRMPADIGVG